MDIFEVHRRIMGDYASYIRSFVSIADDEMRSGSSNISMKDICGQSRC